MELGAQAAHTEHGRDWSRKEINSQDMMNDNLCSPAGNSELRGGAQTQPLQGGQAADLALQQDVSSPLGPAGATSPEARGIKSPRNTAPMLLCRTSQPHAGVSGPAQLVKTVNSWKRNSRMLKAAAQNQQILRKSSINLFLPLFPKPRMEITIPAVST